MIKMTNAEIFENLYEGCPTGSTTNKLFQISLAELLPIGGTPMTATEIKDLYAEKTGVAVTVQKITGNLRILWEIGVVKRVEVKQKVAIKQIVKMKRNPDKSWVPVVKKVTIKPPAYSVTFQRVK